MKRISVILIIGLVLVACGEQTESLMSLDKGTLNTVALSNGEVVYKLDGEWSCVFEATMNPKHEDIVKISQDGNTFVGIYMEEGPYYMSPGYGAIKGELEKNGFKSLYVNTVREGWTPATGKISENCNKIVAETKVQGLNIKIRFKKKIRRCRLE